MAGYVQYGEMNQVIHDIARETLYTEQDVSLNIDNLSKIKNCEKLSFTELMKILNGKNASVKLTTTVGNMYELGQVIKGGTTLTAIVTHGTSPTTKIQFFKDGAVLSTILTGLTNQRFTHAYGIDITTTSEFKVVVTCADGSVSSASFKINFYNPFFIGITSKEIDEVSPADILAMSKVVSGRKDVSHKYTLTKERAVFAYDKNYGELSSILDPSSFENLHSFAKKELLINGVMYYVYILTSKVFCSDFEYRFKF